MGVRTPSAARFFITWRLSDPVDVSPTAPRHEPPQTLSALIALDAVRVTARFALYEPAASPIRAVMSQPTSRASGSGASSDLQPGCALAGPGPRAFWPAR